MSEPALSEEAKAAWAAAKEARRSVTAAWVGVLANLSVVAVAVAAPYLQQHIQLQDLERRHDEIKAGLISDIARATRDSRLPTLLPVPENARDPADPRLISFMIDRADHMIDMADRQTAELRELYSNAREFPDLNRLVLDYTSFLTNFRNNAMLVRGQLANRPDLRVGNAFDLAQSIMRDFDVDVRNLRLLAELNTDSVAGAVRPGPVIFGSCREVAHRASCERPLESAVQPTEQAR